MNNSLQLKPQEPSFSHSASCNQFQPCPDKPFLATPGAMQKFGPETIVECLGLLQQQALAHEGIDYLQVFESNSGDRLWFIEDGEGGAITAMLPEEY